MTWRWQDLDWALDRGERRDQQWGKPGSCRGWWGGREGMRKPQGPRREVAGEWSAWGLEVPALYAAEADRGHAVTRTVG